MARPHCIINCYTSSKIRTVFGHLYQTRKTTRSTKSEQLELDMETYLSPKRQEHTNCVFAAIGLANPDTGKLYIDLKELYKENKGGNGC